MALTPGFGALVVDDDALCRDVTAALLQRRGAGTVVKAHDGGAALGWADTASTPVELVICDLRMPDVDGIETLVGLAARTRPDLVVIASGADPRILRAAAQTVARAGIANVQTLSKPITPEKLDAALAARTGTDHARWSAWEARTVVPPDCSTKIVRGMAAGEFVPFFEPKLAPAKPLFLGAEAHLRWVQPTYGVLSAESFAGVADSVDLFDEIYFAFLDQAAVTAIECAHAGHELRLDIALPPKLLAAPDLPRRLQAVFARFGLAAEQISWQVTEPFWSAASREDQEVLTRLRLRDFGLVASECEARPATLKQLENAPFNAVKLGAHVIEAASNGASDADALADFTARATRQGLRVIAKSADAPCHHASAAELGCHEVQGRAIAPPLPEAEFTTWLAEQPRPRPQR